MGICYTGDPWWSVLRDLLCSYSCILYLMIINVYDFKLTDCNLYLLFGYTSAVYSLFIIHIIIIVVLYSYPRPGSRRSCSD